MDKLILLQDLIDSRFNGNKAEFARAIKRDASQVTQWLGGYKGFGPGSQRNIEQRLGLPSYYFDSPLAVPEDRAEYLKVSRSLRPCEFALVDEIETLPDEAVVAITKMVRRIRNQPVNIDRNGASINQNRVKLDSPRKIAEPEKKQSKDI